MWIKCGNQSLSAINACIDYASWYEGGAPNYWLHGIAQCESGKNPYADNKSSDAYGLFQFMPGTWASTIYAAKNWSKAKWQSLAAAWMYRQGRSGEWVCKA